MTRFSPRQLFFTKKWTQCLVPFSYRLNVKNWLDGLLVRYLKWREVIEDHYDTEVSVDVDRIEDIESHELVGQILRADRDIRDCFHVKPTTVLLDPSIFEELTGNKDFRQYVTYTAERKEIFGIQIKVVPWMTGWVMI